MLSRSEPAQNPTRKTDPPLAARSACGPTRAGGAVFIGLFAASSLKRFRACRRNWRRRKYCVRSRQNLVAIRRTFDAVNKPQIELQLADVLDRPTVFECSKNCEL